MKFGYKFSNLCGTVYRQGNVVFTPDGNKVISPVGNRVSVFDLVNNTSCTLPFETRKNIKRIALSPDGQLLLIVDEQGQVLLINFRRKVLLHYFNFKKPVYDVKFSPNGRFFAVTNGKHVQVWRTPGKHPEFAPFALYRTYTGHYDDVVCLDWSSDSRMLVTGSLDSTCRVYALDPVPGYKPVTLTAHRDRIINCWFDNKTLDIYSVSRDGTMLRWSSQQNLVPLAELVRHDEKRRRRAPAQKESESDTASSSEEDQGAESGHSSGAEEDGEAGSPMDAAESGSESGSEADGESHGSSSSSSSSAEEEEEEEEVERVIQYKWSLIKDDKHYFQQDHAKVVCAAFHKPSGVLTVGFTNGVFGLYELPDFSNIHTLSISQKQINTVAVNASGEWLCFGTGTMGQLLVWEWQSETYVLKQQGHFFDMNVLDYSPNGQNIVTGGDDGKVKMWNTSSGFCFVTFKEHSGGITSVKYAPNGMAVVSASLDGTVRAFDLMRYRNFRTFTTPRPVQFSCLAIDHSGEIICAGCQDDYDIYVWSMQTGKLIDVMAGHEAPVSALDFHPNSAILASASWDKCVKVWDVFENKGSRESLLHGSDVVGVAWRPDGKQLVSSTMNGQISIWEWPSARQTGSIEGRRDIAGGRLEKDKVTAAHSASTKCFTSLCYTADGSCLLAGGRTKYVCIYELKQKVLLKRFCISENQSLDGTQDKLNSRFMTEGGSLNQIQDHSDEDVQERLDLSMPGATKGDLSSRRTRPEVRTKHLRFSPTGRAWAAASTEGLLIYSLDDSFVFDPFDLDVDVTPDSTRQTLARGESQRALAMAFRLNEDDLIQEVVESVPAGDIQLIAQSLPLVYTQRMLAFLGARFETTRHIEFYLSWCCHLFNAHGRFINDNPAKFMTVLRAVQKAVTRQQELVGRLCDDNRYSLAYLQQLASTASADALGAIEAAVAV